jgi:3-(3-hydroxy-phenyl)propionate hydroxylase
VYRPVRDNVMQLKFKPKPRFAQGFFIGTTPASALVTAGQLLPQPMVELPGGAHVAMDEVLGQGFALLALAGADVADALASLASTGLACRHVQVVAQSDDFLKTPAVAPLPDAVLRDQDGTLEKIIRSAGAQAVLLRPDRYVLAYLDGQNLAGSAELRQLLQQFASRRTEAPVKQLSSPFPKAA